MQVPDEQLSKLYDAQIDALMATLPVIGMDGRTIRLDCSEKSKAIKLILGEKGLNDLDVVVNSSTANVSRKKPSSGWVSLSIERDFISIELANGQSISINENGLI